MSASQEKPTSTQAAAATTSEFDKKLDQEVAQMQLLLKHLADKVEEAEREAEEDAQPSGTQQHKVADALKDMMQAEQAMGSFEARLDQLLGNLDKMLEESQDQSQAGAKAT
ncbi:hypothetical protein EC988_007934 [Linderina pennispora]|nr:hypothetical protein EC988_007934 [Linderina pennispora]